MKIRKILYTAEGTPFYLGPPHICTTNMRWYRTLYTLEGVPFFEVQGKDALRRDEELSCEHLDEHGRKHGRKEDQVIWTGPKKLLEAA